MLVSRVIPEIDMVCVCVPNPRISGDRQERIDHGELIRWTKGFGAPNTEGRDVAAMFRDSLKRYVSFFSLFSSQTQPLSVFDTGRTLECAHRTDGAYQRHYRNPHRIVVRQSAHTYRSYLRYWL
jgi:hexokinase